MNDNKGRADLGEKAIAEYMDEEGIHAALVDLLANLMHLANREGLDFDAAVDTAYVHFGAEIKEEA